MKAYWWILIALLAFTGLMMALFGVVGGLVIGVAIFSVVGVMYIVLQEKHDMRNTTSCRRLRSRTTRSNRS